MKIGKVIGKADSSIKLEELEGSKLLVVQEMSGGYEFNGKVLLCADPLSAGIGDVVAVTTGGAAGWVTTGGAGKSDAVVVAILDHIMIGSREIALETQEKKKEQ
jgi:microcompartment protein CcmK/EutM